MQGARSRTPRRGVRVLALALGCGLPLAAGAHSFGRVYNLPVPVWLYLYGAAAALALSFLLIGYFVTAGRPGATAVARDLTDTAFGAALRRLRVVAMLRWGGLAGLLLCVVTGLFGTPNPYGNFSMTFFWVVFVLGWTYLTALVGDLYSVANPWRTLSELLARWWPGFARGRLRYPARLASWPALLLYLLFISIELFGEVTPRSLALILSAYTALNLAGVWLVGSTAWFRHCEFFGVMFRLVATLAPVAYRPARDDPRGHSRLWLRPPFVGAMRAPVPDVSVLVFVLFMLSSTAFDGLHETVVWRRLFFVDLYEWLLRGWVGDNPFVAFPEMNRLFGWWQLAWLWLSPLVYLLIYGLFIWLTRLAAGDGPSVRTLACRFTLSLLPIALVYHITHYYTLLQTQGIKILALASDPFGRDWNLFGTADWFQRTIVPDAGTVWHVQVGLIVFGHVVGVYLAHLEALRVFPGQRQAVASQVPMLVLMVLFTTAGLWILSLPIQG